MDYFTTVFDVDKFVDLYYSTLFKNFCTGAMVYLSNGFTVCFAHWWSSRVAIDVIKRLQEWLNYLLYDLVKVRVSNRATPCPLSI